MIFVHPTGSFFLASFWHHFPPRELCNLGSALAAPLFYFETLGEEAALDGDSLVLRVENLGPRTKRANFMTGSSYRSGYQEVCQMAAAVKKS